MTNAAVPGVRRLDHVGLNVPDLGAAVDFFVAAFGARVVFELERFVDVAGGAFERLGADRNTSLALTLIEIGDARLELLEWGDGASTNEGWPATAALGASHVAIEVSDLGLAVERARSLDGVSVIGEPVVFEGGPTPGLANAFVVSPWGSLIEIVCWTKGRP